MWREEKTVSQSKQSQRSEWVSFSVLPRVNHKWNSVSCIYLLLIFSFRYYLMLPFNSLSLSHENAARRAALCVCACKCFSVHKSFAFQSISPLSDLCRFLTDQRKKRTKPNLPFKLFLKTLRFIVHIRLINMTSVSTEWRINDNRNQI